MTGQPTEQADVMERLRGYASVLQRTYHQATDLSDAYRRIGDSAFNAGQVHAYGHALRELRKGFPELERLLLGVEREQK